MKPKRLKLGIFNIQACVGTTKGYWHYLTTAWKYVLPHDCPQLAKICDALGRNEIDIMGFAEIDAGSLRTRDIDMPAEIARCSPLEHFEFFPTIPHLRAINQGNSIHSRFPLKKCRNHKLPGLGEPRFIAEAEFDFHGHPITFFTTHLSLHPFHREKQIHEIVRLVNKKQNPVVLAGDFNIGHHSETEIIFESKLKTIISQKTFPSWRPSKYLDYFFLSEEFHPVRNHTDSERLSDHLLFVAEVEFRPKTA